MTSRRPRRALLVFSAVVTVVTWPLSLVVWRATRQAGLAISLFGLGLSLGPCLAAYGLAATERKQAWRRVVLTTGGLAILAFALLDAVGLDLEAFFALLLLGTMGAAVGHTLATTILGPLAFGRLLCGWGCWRAMVLESLPLGKGAGRRTGVWSWTPFLGLALSFGAAAVSTFVLHVHPGGLPGRLCGESVVPVAVGIGVYYAVSIGLAFALSDQRAFCKYLCPSGQILRWTSRRALAGIRSRPDLCTDCDACAHVCPMDIPVAEHARRGGRVGGGECILCQRCVTSCPSGALRMSLGPGRGRAGVSARPSGGRYGESAADSIRAPGSLETE
jgi:ferredoxin-type protein NapH